ncbi:MAG: HAD family hydrolase [Pseudomonadales bacterium]|nr:HAD family hydrolase [Pseudomonadales bacterium]
MALAIFDLDNTLINGDSDHAWGEFLVQQGYVDADYYQDKNDYFYQQYQQGSLDIDEYLQFALKPLTTQPRATLEGWQQQFMQSVIAPMMLPKAQALLQQHRDAGDYLLIISATNSFVTRPIAKALQVDDILSSDPEEIEGRFTGKVSGVPCFQEGKISRLQQWLSDKPLSLEGSYFYSDSINDLPLLKVVDQPVVVDADARLLQEAKLRNWPIISLR